MYENCSYELQGLEKLFATGLSGVCEPQGLFEIVQSPDFIKAEIARIKHRFIQKSITFEDEGSLHRYVEFHQKALVWLMDEIYSPMGPPFYSDCYADLEGLLSFIRRHFRKYFDHDSKAPSEYVDRWRNELATSLPSLEDTLGDGGVDPSIVKVALHPLKKFVASKSGSDFSYRSVRYVKQMRKQLLKLTPQCGTSQENEEAIHRLFYYVNYNSMRCFNYLVEYISGITADAGTHGEKIERLTLIQKQVNQMFVKRGIGYYGGRMSLRNQISSYLSEEIDYLVQLQKPEVIKPVGSDENDFSEFKMKLDMSVAQLGCLIKVLTDMRIIQNRNIAELIRFFSNYCETKRSGHVSKGSLRVKFYNIESGTREAVEGMIARVMSCVRG